MSEAPDTGFSLILHYSPEMVAELALGADHPHEIAERYGVDAQDYEHLASQEWFQRLVVQKRHEYHDTGQLFVAKAGMMAEALLTRLFQQSMANVLAAPLTVEVAKQLTEIGRLKPQPINTQPGAAGGAFQINIMVGDRDITASSHTVTVPAPVEPTLDTPAMTLDFAAPSPAPHADTVITGLRVPDFDMRPTGVPPVGLPLRPTQLPSVAPLFPPRSRARDLGPHLRLDHPGPSIYSRGWVSDFPPRPAGRRFAASASAGRLRPPGPMETTLMPGLATQLPPPGPKQVISAAKVGGGAATLSSDPTLINAPFVKVSSVATAADSVTLPNTQGGDMILIQNQGAAALAVFGWGGATVNGVASVSHANGLGALYVASMEGTWTRFLQG